MSARHRVELKRCRPGLRDQEFAYTLRGEEQDGVHEVAAITHVPTGVELAVAVGGDDPLFNVTRVFDDGLFLGSDEYVHLKVFGSNYLANGVSSLLRPFARLSSSCTAPVSDLSYN